MEFKNSILSEGQAHRSNDMNLIKGRCCPHHSQIETTYKEMDMHLLWKLISICLTSYTNYTRLAQKKKPGDRTLSTITANS